MSVPSVIADSEDITLIFREFLRQNVAVPVAAMNALVSKIKVFLFFLLSYFIVNCFSLEFQSYNMDAT
jgi:hypothetical protein